MCVDSVGSGAASNVSSPGVLQQQRASLVESITSDISAVSVGHSGLSSTASTVLGEWEQLHLPQESVGGSRKDKAGARERVRASRVSRWVKKGQGRWEGVNACLKSQSVGKERTRPVGGNECLPQESVGGSRKDKAGGRE